MIKLYIQPALPRQFFHLGFFRGLGRSVPYALSRVCVCVFHDEGCAPHVYLKERKPEFLLGNINHDPLITVI